TMELRKRFQKEESVKMKNWVEALQPTEEKPKEPVQEKKPDIPQIVQNTLKPIVIEENKPVVGEVQQLRKTVGSVKISVNKTEVKHHIEEKGSDEEMKVGWVIREENPPPQENKQEMQEEKPKEMTVKTGLNPVVEKEVDNS